MRNSIAPKRRGVEIIRLLPYDRRALGFQSRKTYCAAYIYIYSCVYVCMCAQEIQRLVPRQMAAISVCVCGKLSLRVYMTDELGTGEASSNFRSLRMRAYIYR